MTYDALIIGAGPAGSTCALMLARAGWNVALVEKAQFPRRKVCGEFISATSLPLLFELGIGADYLALAGPPVRDTGLYGDDTTLRAPMPLPDGMHRFGHALGRECFDALLLRAAARSGAEIIQPWSAEELVRAADGSYTAKLANRRETRGVRARIVIAAHGSWEHGGLPTQVPATMPRASDLFAFKAHFAGSALPPGFMPLVVFPGGYGGMVTTDGGRATLSCCIRRDRLARVRRGMPGVRAADAVLAHIRAHCAGVRSALQSAVLDGSWLAAGPIRPGTRPASRDGIFVVGNAAGEAHPLVAEGISMAIQSGWLLSRRLIAADAMHLPRHQIAILAEHYASEWQHNFRRRIQASSVFAQLAVRPLSAEIAAALLSRMPALLTFGARLAGKDRTLRTA